MSQIWLYAAVASLHLPGIGLLAYLLRDLATSDPPSAAPVPPPDEPPGGWRWRPRPGPAQRGPASGSRTTHRLPTV